MHYRMVESVDCRCVDGATSGCARALWGAGPDCRGASHFRPSVRHVFRESNDGGVMARCFVSVLDVSNFVGWQSSRFAFGRSRKQPHGEAHGSRGDAKRSRPTYPKSIALQIRGHDSVANIFSAGFRKRITQQPEYGLLRQSGSPRSARARRISPVCAGVLWRVSRSDLAPSLEKDAVSRATGLVRQRADFLIIDRYGNPVAVSDVPGRRPLQGNAHDAYLASAWPFLEEANIPFIEVPAAGLTRR